MYTNMMKTECWNFEKVQILSLSGRKSVCCSVLPLVQVIYIPQVKHELLTTRLYEIKWSKGKGD